MYLFGAAQLSPRSGPLLQRLQEVSRKRPLQRGAVVATSAPGLAHLCSHLHRAWAHRCHICTGTGLTAAASALGLGPPPLHLHRDWGSPAATSAPRPPDRCAFAGAQRAVRQPRLLARRQLRADHAILHPAALLFAACMRMRARVHVHTCSGAHGKTGRRADGQGAARAALQGAVPTS